MIKFCIDKEIETPGRAMIRICAGKLKLYSYLFCIDRNKHLYYIGTYYNRHCPVTFFFCQI